MRRAARSSTRSRRCLLPELGVIVGYAYTGTIAQPDNWPTFHASRWSDGVMNDLGVFPGHHHSYALAINNHDDIVGVGIPVNGAINPPNRALLWRNGQIIDLNIHETLKAVTAELW